MRGIAARLHLRVTVPQRAAEETPGIKVERFHYQPSPQFDSPQQLYFGGFKQPYALYIIHASMSTRDKKEKKDMGPYSQALYVQSAESVRDA